MDGILIIDKPEGSTSHDVVARLRRILKTKKIGHTGTLDPFATGVLVMLVGKATRLARFIDKDEKEYLAVVRFGSETDTGDRVGKQIPGSVLRNKVVTEKLKTIDWESVLPHFRGEILQIPPMFSAKKINGKKLYEQARRGVELERMPININIKELEIIDPGTIRNAQTAIAIRVVCSAGTYIRTLAEDLGRATGIGAHLDELRRIRAGKFGIADAVTLEDLENAGDPSGYLRPIGDAVADLPQFMMADERIEKTKNGLASRVPNTDLRNGAAVRMIDPNGRLVAIGIYDSAELLIRPKIVLV